MCESHGRFSLVDVLTAGSAGFAGLKHKIRVLDFDLNILHLRKDCYRGRRGLYAPLRFGYGHTLYAMHTRLKLEAGIGALSFDKAGDLAKAPKLGLICRRNGHLKASRLRVHTIHTEQISRKECCLLASRACTDLYNN